MTTWVPVVPPFRDGLLLGVNAVSDVVVVIDCPEGCYFQVERVGLSHDWSSTLLDPMGARRAIQTEVDYARLPFGTEDALERTVERAVQRLDPALVLLAQATMVEVTGNDLAAIADRLQQRVARPVRAIPSASLEGDCLDGFAAFVGALVDALAPERVLQPDAVGVVGYLPDRLEHDHRANVAELMRLVELTGRPCAGVLCDGGDTAAARRTLGAGTLVGLPHGRGAATRAAARTGARAVELPLPLGLAGTSGWVSALGEAVDATDVAADATRAELAALVPDLDRARTACLQGRSAVLAHDPVWAAGLLPYLHELALHVPLVALRRRRGPPFTAIDPTGGSPRVLDDYAPAELLRALEQVDPDGRVAVVLGAHDERAVAALHRSSFVELGYPSLTTHALAPRPLLGFTGARRLADELVNAVLAHEWATTAFPGGTRPGERP